jgi:predicted unusual protein kinase regulating ubiquinone biosynthesis (AarF/ABC1/UbiB family)
LVTGCRRIHCAGSQGRTKDEKVAVKILRPGVEKRFADDLSSFFFAARMMERFSREAQRLRPVAAVEMLEHSMKLELDLRMEASAISEMAKATADDPNFRLPAVNWPLTARQVLTTEWIDGTPISDIATLRSKGFDSRPGRQHHPELCAMPSAIFLPCGHASEIFCRRQRPSRGG